SGIYHAWRGLSGRTLSAALRRLDGVAANAAERSGRRDRVRIRHAVNDARHAARHGVAKRRHELGRRRYEFPMTSKRARVRREVRVRKTGADDTAGIMGFLVHSDGTEHG